MGMCVKLTSEIMGLNKSTKSKFNTALTRVYNFGVENHLLHQTAFFEK